MRLKIQYGVTSIGEQAEDEIELEDGMTDEEIEKAVYDYVSQFFDWGYEIIDQ